MSETIPRQIGPCEFAAHGLRMVAVRCPREYDALMRQAGGVWDPDSQCWLIHPRRLGPMIRMLRQQTDPLFRQNAP